jgi:hypothetical protein
MPGWVAFPVWLHARVDSFRSRRSPPQSAAISGFVMVTGKVFGHDAV